MKQRLLNPQAARRVIAGLLLLFMALPMMAQGQSPVIWSGNVADQIENKNDGTGKVGSPILIKNGEELAYLAQQTNAKGDLRVDQRDIDGTDGFFGYYFALSDNIDLKGIEWVPIGKDLNITFNGHFDGKGFCVSGLTVGSENNQYDYAGLFGCVKNGTIQNLGVRLAKDGIWRSFCAGGIVGRIYGGSNSLAAIRNCYVEGPGLVKTTGSIHSYAGGIVGFVEDDSSLSHCYSTVNVEAIGNDDNTNNYAGGIAGRCHVTISHTYATGIIKASGVGKKYAGGICGFANYDASLSNNLALNKEIEGNANSTSRVVYAHENATLTNNYASPETYVNGKPVGSKDANGEDGSDKNIDLTNYAATLKGDPANEWESGAWVFTPEGLLPQLQMVTGKNPAGTLTYGDWNPDSPQPQLPAANYLIATEIVNAGGDDESGNSWDKPIEIANRAELAYFAKTVNEKGTLKVNGRDDIVGDNGFSGYYFALSNDIDLRGIDWTPIGIDPTQQNSFRGHFDGKGHCVSGLSVGYGSNQYEYAGLFGYVQNGTIQNLGVRLAKDGIWGSFCAGGIVGRIYGGKNSLAAIRNCYVEGPGLVKATGSIYSYAGGIVGYFEKYSSLSHCYSTVNVEAIGNNKTSNNCAGGIAGECYGTISHTYATGIIKASGVGEKYAGGICGYANYDASLSNNLALNKEIEGDARSTHRVAGEDADADADSKNKPKLANNYASPETYVNGKPVISKEANGFDGSETGIDLTNYAATLINAPAPANAPNEWDSGAWVFDKDGILLPQLQMVTGENPDGRPNTYGKWPSSIPQPQLRAGNHMGIAKIEKGGNGDSWAEAIQISNSAELKYLGKMVNTIGDLTVGDKTINNNGTGFEGKYFILTDNIDLSAYHWEPIGKGININFNGHFDGQGHCISGLSVGYGNDQYDYAGLFGRVKNGTIQNLGVSLAKDGIWGSFRAGGIVGEICGEINSLAAIRNCYVEGPGLVKATTSIQSYAGGIVGLVEYYSSLSHCYSTVNVEAIGNNGNSAGGIAGTCYETISHTYATGNIKAAGGKENYAGGICGYANHDASLSNNLALNKEIEGDTDFTHRVAARHANPDNKPTLASNYASPKILINGSPVANKETNSFDGSDDIHTKDYEKALKTDVTEDNKQPWVFGGTNHLPKLRMVISEGLDGPEYGDWPDKSRPVQPTLSPADYLHVKFTLHIVAPTGGSVTVKDGANNDITHGTFVLPGTTLTLSHSDNDNYDFVGFLSGTDQDNLSNCDATLTMPEADLWVSGQFKEKPKPEPDPTPDPDPDPTPDPTPDPPYVPVYFTVTLPSVEGATTDPAPGDYKVESWDNFRFYLTLNPDYSESQPVVTTSRGETIQPRKSDGAYLVKYVRSDVQLFIDGIQLNNPTANADIEADALRIYAVGNTLMISAPRTAEAMVCDLSGRLLRTCNILPGLTRIEGLRAGIYIVKVNGFEGVKVVIR